MPIAFHPFRRRAVVLSITLSMSIAAITQQAVAQGIKIKTWFETKKGGEVDINVQAFFEVDDPDKHIPFIITNYFITK
jgi:hypothetical protein